MKFLFQNLWERKKAVAIVIVLLIAQALCELSLPNYTADIVDVGIQQNGVDSVAVEKMRQETHNWMRFLISMPAMKSRGRLMS